MFGVWLGRPRVPSGAWPHVPGVCQLLDDKDTDAIKWPPIPPDLNLIEHFLYRPPWLTIDDSGADWRPNPGVEVHPYPIRSMLWWCSDYIQTQWGHTQYWATSGVALREFTEVGEQPGCQPASFEFRCSLLNYFLQDRESLIFVWFSTFSAPFTVHIVVLKQRRCGFFTFTLMCKYCINILCFRLAKTWHDKQCN